MNWRAWCKGAVAALANGLITALLALAVLKAPPSIWELFVIAIIPCLITFLTYVKQSPPPWDGIDRRNNDPPGVAKISS